MVTLISHNVQETEALGESWGRAAQPGWAIGLSGDLGAGKTQLVKGLARGLGIVDRVHSPTFALAIEYVGGRMPLYHLDLYRLKSPDEIIGAGLDEFFDQRLGVTVIEWAERWTGFIDLQNIDVRYRQVRIQVLGELDRQITYEDFGA